MSLEPAAKEEQLRAYYRALFRARGRQHWWPARTRFEVIVGAYLTQNTAWTNVERALRSLRAGGVLSLNGIRTTPLPQLEAMMRSAGYFRQKARRLKLFVAFLDERYGGSLNRMFAEPAERLREQLLVLNGIGPETADSILLYAAQKPVFVVDAYTRRVLDRHGILPAKTPYEEIRSLVESALANIGRDEHAWEEPGLRNNLPGEAHPPSPMSLARRSPLAQVYNEMHALIVSVGKHHCLKSAPQCDACPLQRFLPGMK
jgi:endonuclease III related protein